jgi:hypothetical protein
MRKDVMKAAARPDGRRGKEVAARNLGKPKQKSSQGQIFILSIFCILLSAADFVGRKFKPKPK